LPARRTGGFASEAVDDRKPLDILDLRRALQAIDQAGDLSPRAFGARTQSLDDCRPKHTTLCLGILPAELFVVAATTEQLIGHADEDRVDCSSIIQAVIDLAAAG
jgi:hypothetical protein